MVVSASFQTSLLGTTGPSLGKRYREEVLREVQARGVAPDTLQRTLKRTFEETPQEESL
jgi:hypothetical protein